MTIELEEVQRRIDATEIAKLGAYVDLVQGEPLEVIVDGAASAKNLRELANALDPHEAVAWRVSYNDGASWKLMAYDPSVLLAGVMGVIIRPLVEA